MGDVQVGASDVPNDCGRCATVTMHRAGPDGRLHCLRCVANAMQIVSPAPPTTLLPGEQMMDCPFCGNRTIHSRGAAGPYWCVPCLKARPPEQRAAMPAHPATVVQRPMMPQIVAPQQPQVVRVQQVAGGGVVRSTIDAAKFVLAVIFLVCVGTCVYVCGKAGQEMNKHSTTTK